MRRIIRAVFFAALAVVLISPLLSGCSAPCTYPDQRGVKIRILNAMPDMPVITVFVNGKLFVQNFTYDPPADFGYLETYKDGSPLSAGDSVLFVVTSDGLGKDTLFSQRVSINFNRQTVIVMGRGHRKFPQPKTSLILRLDDQQDIPDPNHTLIRFVHAVPDLPALDIFYKGDATGKPDTTIFYGEINKHLVLDSIIGLTVTEHGNPNNVIFSFPHFFAIHGFFVTTVIRGETKPLGTDFTAAPLVLSDASIGNFIFNFKTFAVRLVNASRATQLSLLIRSTFVTPENGLSPRTNYPNQQKVLGIKADTVSDFMPLNISLDSIAEFWFSNDNVNNDTVGFIDTGLANIRYSKIAVEENIFGSSGKKLSHLTLPDTMTNPVGNFGRIRVINLSPDHQFIMVTMGNGAPVKMNRKDVKFFDAPVGNLTITLSDGTSTGMQNITVLPATPVSVYILPEQSTINPKYPIATSKD